MCKLKSAILILCSLFCLYGVDVDAYATGADIKAPIVKNATIIQPSEVKKPTDSEQNKISVKLEIEEEGTGVKTISVSMYGYKGKQLVTLYGSMDETTQDVYTGDVFIDVPVTSQSVAGIYYFGQIDTEDYAGNKRCYWAGWNPNGYETDEEGYYLPDFNDGINKCYIVDGKTANVISDGDNEAPFVTNVTIQTPSVKKGQDIQLILEYSDEADISELLVAFYAYKGEKLVHLVDSTLFSCDVKWKKEDGKVYVTIPTNLAESGNYYLGQITIKDEVGNERLYSNAYDKSGYAIDSVDSYIPDAWGDYKCYVKSGTVVEVCSNGDDTAPYVEKVIFNKSKVVKPGVLEAEVYVRDNKDVKSVGMCLYKNVNGNIELISSNEQTLNISQSGTVKLIFPISTSTQVGKYELGQIDIEDSAGNKRTYWDGWLQAGDYEDEKGRYIPDFYDPTLKVYKPATVSVEEEFDVAFEMGISNPKLISSIEKMSEKEAAKIFIGSNAVAPAEIFSAIAGKDKTLIFYKNNYQWVFNGKNINPKRIKDVKLKLTITTVSGEKFGHDGNVIKIQFPSNGKLPGKARIRIKSDYTYMLYQMNHSMVLYYYDQQNRKLDKEQNSKIKYILDGTDHWCEFNVSHNSVFIATGEELMQTDLDKIPKKIGTKIRDKKSKAVYKVTNSSQKNPTVEYVCPSVSKVSSVSVPSYVTYKKVKYKVTSVGANAFKANKKKLKTVKIPSTVTKIGTSAFAGCTKLKTVSIGKNVKTIGKNAFYNCTALTKITIPSKVTTIGSKAFYNCKKLKNISIQTTKLIQKNVGKDAFKKIYSKATIKVPKSKLKLYKTILKAKGVGSKVKFKK